MNKELKATKKESKKANKQVEEMKKKLANKDAINKLHVERMGNIEQENIRLKDENKKAKEEGKKLQTELKQIKTELEEARDGAVNFVEENSGKTRKLLLTNTREGLSSKIT